MNYRNLFNLGVNIVASVVFFVLLIISIFAGGIKKKTDRIFSIVIAFVLFVLVLNSIFYAFLYTETNSDALYITLKTLIMVFFDLAALLCLIYCVSYFELSDKNKALSIGIATLLCIISIVLKAINYSLGYFFDIKNSRVIITNHYWANYVFISLVLMFCLVLTFVKKNLRRSERISFMVFAGIPLIAAVFHSIFTEYGIIVFALCASFLFHYVFYYIERGKIIAQQQNELTEQQINVMISQIQPHFIYNCLSSISYLCKTDPEKAEQAVNEFSNYLRGNFSNLSQTKLIPFKKELEYAGSYIKLEKLRFEDRVNVVFDIQADNFNVPSLSIQPLIENAIKHGICKKIDGGTVTISTWEDTSNNYVKVEDNGVGFDLNAPKKEEERVHVGLANTTERIKKMCNGSVSVTSTINVGTTVVVTLPKTKAEKK